MADIRIGLEEITRHFHELEDPRSSINQRHPFVSVVVIAIMAVLAGANGPTSIARWAKLKGEFLLGVLDLPNGIPRKDVFRRVLTLLEPAGCTCLPSEIGHTFYSPAHHAFFPPPLDSSCSRAYYSGAYF